MSAVLQISDGTTSIDLLSGNLRLKAGGLSMQTSRGLIWDTLQLQSVATAANLRTTKASLDLLLDQARKYHLRPIEKNPVWLYYRSDGEGSKRALIYDGETQLPSGDGLLGPLLTTQGVNLTLALERSNYWEADTAATPSTTAVTLFGGQWSIGNDAGQADQRISRLQISHNSGGSADRLWCGIRPTRNGTAGFVSIWEAEDGINVTDASDSADATASGSSKVHITFSTDDSLASRFSLDWGSVVGSNPDDIIGEYLVLARMKVDSSGTEVSVQLRDGWGNADETGIVGGVYISGSTNWTIFELGHVIIPPTGNRENRAGTGTVIEDYRLSLYAERISASGTLDVDCFILIPSEHFFYADKCSLSAATGALSIYTGPDGYQYALQVASGGVHQNIRYSLNDWYYPVGGGLLVMCYDLTSSGSTLTQTVDLSAELYPRYEMFKP
jgi:hypothetical protein